MSDSEDDVKFEGYTFSTEDYKYPGFRAALTCFIVSALFLGFNFGTIYINSSYYPKMFIFGFVLLGAAIGFTIAPGERLIKVPKGSTRKEKSDYTFKSGKGYEIVIQIGFAVLALIGGIYVMIKQDLYLCLPICLFALALGSVVLILKTVIIWIIDSTKSLEEKEELSNDETKYSSVLYRVLCILLSVVVGFSCTFFLYEKRYEIGYLFGVKGYENYYKLHHEKWSDKFLKENIDKEVPFRIITSDEDETISFLINIYELTETPDDENDFISLLKAPLSKLISYVMADDERILAFSEDKGYSEYNKKSLEKNTYVQKYFEENPSAFETDFPEFNSILKYLDQLNSEDSEFVEEIISSEAENLLKYTNMWCFVTEPYLVNEFICLWDISSFTEYFNKTYGTSYTEDEIITEFDNGKFKEYDIVCTDVGPALYYFYRQRKDTCGLIINFGTENDDCYSGIAMDKIMSQLCQNEEYLQSVKEFFELEDEDIEKDLAEPKNWWDEDL